MYMWSVSAFAHFRKEQYQRMLKREKLYNRQKSAVDKSNTVLLSLLSLF